MDSREERSDLHAQVKAIEDKHSVNLPHGDITLDMVRKILTESTKILCDNLSPYDLLLDMVSKGAIKPDDVTRIQKQDTDTEKVLKLIEILRKSPVSSYTAFMNVLREERSDLYTQVQAIEDKHSGKIEKPCS